MVAAEVGGDLGGADGELRRHWRVEVVRGRVADQAALARRLVAFGLEVAVGGSVLERPHLEALLADLAAVVEVVEGEAKLVDEHGRAARRVLPAEAEEGLALGA